MERQGLELGKILKDEIIVFEKLYSLEEHKTRAIMEHDGKLLEEISREQDGLLAMIHSLEADRTRKMADCMKAMRIKKENTTLKEIARVEGNTTGARLAAQGRQMGDTITRLNNLLETNRILINDNMEYYNILLKGLRVTSSVDAGYSPEGKEEEILKQSRLFNKTA